MILHPHCSGAQMKLSIMLSQIWSRYKGLTPHLEIIAQMYPKSQKWRRGLLAWTSAFARVEYSCIHSVFNQWIKLSIHSSIDVFLWQLLIHVEQRDTRDLSIIRPAEVSAEGKRWCERHESLIRDSCCMLNYSTATVQLKAEEESISVYRAQVLPLCESLTWSFPYNGS